MSNLSFTEIGKLLSEANLRKKVEQEAFEDEDEEKDVDISSSDEQEFEDSLLSSQDSDDDALQKSMEAVMDRNSLKRRAKEPKKRGRKPSDKFFKGSTSIKLAPEVAALMGRGNVAFVSRNYPDAILLFQQVIQQAPQAFEPYYTLGLIFSELGNTEKTLSYLLIAAHLAPSNSELWKKVGYLSKANNLELQAIYCFKKACLTNDEDWESFWERISLLLKMEKFEIALNALYKKQSNHLLNEELLKEIAQLCVKTGAIQNAINVFEKAIKSCIRPFTGVEFSIFNMLVELYQLGKQNRAIMTLFEDYILCKVFVETYPKKPFLFSPEHLQDHVLLTSIPVELLAKYAIACILEGKGIYLQTVEFILLNCSVEEYSDVIFSIGCAHFDVSSFSEAWSYYELLLNNPQVFRQDLWMKAGVCISKLGNEEEAIDCFTNELELYPQNDECRLLLAKLYESMGRIDEATAIAKQVGVQVKELEKSVKGQELDSDSDAFVPSDLSGDEDVDEDASSTQLMSFKGKSASSAFKRQRGKTMRKRGDNPNKVLYDLAKCKEMRILLEKALFLWDIKEDRHEGFFAASQMLISDLLENEYLYVSVEQRPIRYLRRRTDLKSRQTGTSEEYSQWDQLLNQVYGDDSDDTIPIAARKTRLAALHGIELDEWLDLVNKHIEAAVDRKDPNSAIDLLKKFYQRHCWFSGSKEYKCKLLLLMYGIGIKLNKLKISKDASFALIAYYRDRDFAYGLYRLTVNQYPREFMKANAHKRFTRSSLKYPTRCQDHILSGQISALTRANREAMDMFSHAISLNAKDSMAHLCKGISHLNFAMTRKCTNRHYHVLVGFSLLFKYHELVDKNQESFYNIARAFHQLNIKHLAIAYYEKSLACTKQEEGNNLSMEIAYNLSHIYMSSNAPHMAHAIIRKYNTVQ